MRRRTAPKLPTVERLSKAAILYLERYSSSTENLRRVLERRVVKACRHHERDPADFVVMVETVVDKCLKAGLLNDRAYAETKTTSLRRRGGSRRRIEAQLAAKGVDRETIQSVLADDAQSEIDAAAAFARRRRLGPHRVPGDRKERRDKDLAAMCRAGFSFEIARRIIDTTENDDA